MLALHAISVPDLQDLLWTPGWETGHDRLVAAFQISRFTQMLALTLCQKATPWRRHSQELAQKLGPGKSPLHRLQRFLSVFSIGLEKANVPQMICDRFREEQYKLTVLAFDKKDMPLIGVREPGGGGGKPRDSIMDLKSARRDHQFWIDTVRSRGATDLESCDECGKHQSLTTKLMRCSQCKVARYYSRDCQKVRVSGCDFVRFRLLTERNLFRT
jgi:hypothetical protein